MTNLGALKPVLTSLLMPPASLILLALLGLWLARRGAGRVRGATGRAPRGAGVGTGIAAVSLLLLALLSCHGTAVWLAAHALPQFAPATPASLKAAEVQAIVILGGGVVPLAPEYGQAQPTAVTAVRLHYGAWLSRQTGLPVAFTGGLGWAASDLQAEPESAVAARALAASGITLRWNESGSRDTAGNADLLAPLLAAGGIHRVALVTHARHMPRSVAAFERAGLAVLPAPTAFDLPEQRDLLEWMPSAAGLLASQQVLREWVGLRMGAY